MKKRTNITTHDEMKDKLFGKIGTKKRNELEKGYENFKIGVMLQQARLKKGLTQEQLAKKVGTTKSYISKIENDVKEVRISSLERIVEIGLGGKLELKLKL
ncbi:MAG: helix-turn-helix domain-containing protein [Sediminibacterium sp.]|jgi:ribosome-binding protein aMBF1 (putative translation factor)|nr:helix-turn-helix domain-containing protein [Sediminibacterium sp.]